MRRPIILDVICAVAIAAALAAGSAEGLEHGVACEEGCPPDLFVGAEAVREGAAGVSSSPAFAEDAP